jgi:hypothetical protein
LFKRPFNSVAVYTYGGNLLPAFHAAQLSTNPYIDAGLVSLFSNGGSGMEAISEKLLPMDAMAGGESN